MSLTDGMLWLAAIICLGSIGLTCFAVRLKIREHEEGERESS